MASAASELARVVGLGIELERREEVGGDDLGELLVAVQPLLLEIGGRRQMPRLALLARERFVRNLAQEVLEKAVLPALGRAGVGLERQDLLPQRGPPAGVELGVA